MTSPKLGNFLSFLICVAVLLLLIVASAYFMKFGSFGPGDQATWGQFGDYMGGTLNPLLAFLSLIALLFTVSLQTRQVQMTAEQLQNSKLELEATRKQLDASLQEQRVAGKAMRRQAEYSAAGARLAGLRASLEIVNDEIAEIRDYPDDDNATSMTEALDRRARLVDTIASITDSLMYVRGEA